MNAKPETPNEQADSLNNPAKLANGRTCGTCQWARWFGTEDSLDKLGDKGQRATTGFCYHGCPTNAMTSRPINQRVGACPNYWGEDGKTLDPRVEATRELTKAVNHLYGMLGMIADRMR